MSDSRADGITGREFNDENIALFRGWKFLRGGFWVDSKNASGDEGKRRYLPTSL
jgi:hypothetical protein